MSKLRDLIRAKLAEPKPAKRKRAKRKPVEDDPSLSPATGGAR